MNTKDCHIRGQGRQSWWQGLPCAKPSPEWTVRTMKSITFLFALYYSCAMGQVNYSIDSAIVNRPNSKELLLDLNGGTEFPKGIFELDSLEVLYITNHGLKQIPIELLKLKEIRVLNLKSGSLEEFPDFLSELKHLERLVLADNKIRILPRAIGNFKALKYLNLTSNPIEKISRKIYCLKSLEQFGLGYPDKRELPIKKSKLSQIAKKMTWCKIIIQDKRLT